MYISKVISFGDAWETLKNRFPEQFEEICNFVERLTTDEMAKTNPNVLTYGNRDEKTLTPYHLQALWDEFIKQSKWVPSSAVDLPGLDTRVSLRPIGAIREGVAVAVHRIPEIFNRWLYTVSPIAIRAGLIEIPVAVVLTRATEMKLWNRSVPRFDLNRITNELLAVSPLSHGYPFLILGIGIDQVEVDVLELETESGFGDQTSDVVVNRSIEFPPEYHQAGLGVLTYFGTVLREKYPDQNAKVRIEQDGLTVRLIIETANGNREIIEKALQEYEAVVRGETNPDDFFESRLKVLELKSELRIAKVRIEDQQDLIKLQGEHIATLKDIIGHALSNPKSVPLAITVNPHIVVNATNTVQINNQLSEVSRDLQDLIVLSSEDPAMQLRLLDLDEAVSKVAKETDPEQVKTSSALQKLRTFLVDAGETGSAVNTFVEKISDGVEQAQKLARRYNDIASWCGAPVIPSFLVGKNKD